VPKEYAHWWLASETLERLKAAGEQNVARRLVPVLERNRALFLLGAVGPDYLFYYLFGPALGDFRKAGRILHGGDGSDTLAVLSRRAALWKEAPPPWEVAFLFGFACHVAADAVFHPLVFHYSGKGSGKSEYDHYVFESVLDLYIGEVLKPGNEVPRTLAELTRAMKADREDFLDLLGFTCFGGGAYDRAGLRSCLRRYEFIQARFGKPAWKLLARIAGGLFAGLRNFEPSFYQNRFSSMAKVFESPLAFRHPVTGEERVVTVLSLRDEAVERAAGYASAFAGLLEPGTDGKRAAEILSELRGPNLETGIYGDSAERLPYVAEHGPEPLFGKGYAAYNINEVH